ncbi:MAG TPA: SDR family NAD(P)-dependent oxidoreductase, partial [Nitrospirales bacterium]|nr:SDR family NAD(P)-dependent oxidoreductase [Nitrospirales bacterium]
MLRHQKHPFDINAHHSVTIVDLDSEGGQKTAQDIKEEGLLAFFVQTDVTNESDCKQAVNRTISEFGHLDILFNNAGIIQRTSVLNSSEADWDRVM